MCLVVTLDKTFTSLIYEIRNLQNRYFNIMRQFEVKFYVTEALIKKYVNENPICVPSDVNELDLHVLREVDPSKKTCHDFLCIISDLKARLKTMTDLVENRCLNSLRIVDTLTLSQVIYFCNGVLTVGKIKLALRLYANKPTSINETIFSLIKSHNENPQIDKNYVNIKLIANKLFITLRMDINKNYKNINSVMIKDKKNTHGKREDRLDHILKRKKRKRSGRKQKKKNMKDILDRICEKTQERDMKKMIAANKK